MSHDWGNYPGDDEARSYVPPQPRPEVGNMTPKVPVQSAFEERCKTDPQGVIKDLVAQTGRQGKEIYDLNQTVAALTKRLEKVEKKQNDTKGLP